MNGPVPELGTWKGAQCIASDQLLYNEAIVNSQPHANLATLLQEIFDIVTFGVRSRVEMARVEIKLDPGSIFMPTAAAF